MMKDEKMKNKLQKQYCKKCGSEMIYVDHWEDDGDLGSHEPYFECTNGCLDPEEPKRIDTCTEYDSIVPTDSKESEIL